VNEIVCLEIFSDGVFVIVVTLLIFEIMLSGEGLVVY